MTRQRSRIYMPVRNVVGSFLPVLITALYLLFKLDGTALKVLVVVAALAALSASVYVSSRTRKERRSFFWDIYNYMTAHGRLPLRLLSGAFILILCLGVLFELTGGVQRVSSAGGTPRSFIIRFVEVDIYWSLLNFLGISDSTLEAQGFGKFLTLLTAACGLLFWGMYISVLVNKHLELQAVSHKDAPEHERTLILYNEPSTAEDAEDVLENSEHDEDDDDDLSCAPSAPENIISDQHERTP